MGVCVNVDSCALTKWTILHAICNVFITSDVNIIIVQILQTTITDTFVYIWAGVHSFSH